MIQYGNWRGARDLARGLEGHVMQVTHHNIIAYSQNNKLSFLHLYF